MTDIDAARAELAARGAEMSEVFHDAGAVFHHGGTVRRVAGPALDHKSYGSFASFSNLDGNGWLIRGQLLLERFHARLVAARGQLSA